MSITEAIIENNDKKKINIRQKSSNIKSLSAEKNSETNKFSIFVEFNSNNDYIYEYQTEITNLEKIIELFEKINSDKYKGSTGKFFAVEIRPKFINFNKIPKK